MIKQKKHLTENLIYIKKVKHDFTTEQKLTKSNKAMAP